MRPARFGSTACAQVRCVQVAGCLHTLDLSGNNISGTRVATAKSGHIRSIADTDADVECGLGPLVDAVALSGIRRLSLADCFLGPAAIVCVARCAWGSSALECLDLRGNIITGARPVSGGSELGSRMWAQPPPLPFRSVTPHGGPHH